MATFFPSLEASEANTVSKFVIGRISIHQERAYADLKAMNGYLASSLRHGTEIEFGEVVVSSLSEMAPLLKSGAVDMVSETPLGAIELENVANAQIILHEWKKGVSDYASFIIAHKDSGINTLDDLRDKVIAFEDPGSTSGFLIPMSIMRDKKIPIMELTDRNQRPDDGAVGYIFAGVELSIGSLVARKIVDAGAVSDLNWHDQKEIPTGFKQRLKIVHRSGYVPRSTVVVREGLPKGFREELIQLFTEMHMNKAGAEAMKKYHGVAKYEAITQEKKERLVQLRRMHSLIEEFIK